MSDIGFVEKKALGDFISGAFNDANETVKSNGAECISPNSLFRVRFDDSANREPSLRVPSDYKDEVAKLLRQAGSREDILREPGDGTYEVSERRTSSGQTEAVFIFSWETLQALSAHVSKGQSVAS